MSLVKVLLVDDHDMVRMGLKTYLMLDPMFEVIGEAANGHEALAMLRELGQESLPDLVLMDLMMPVMNGAETTRAVLAEFPGLKIVILTSFLEDDLVVDAIEAGAVSYVLKTVSAEEPDLCAARRLSRHAGDDRRCVAGADPRHPPAHGPGRHLRLDRAGEGSAAADRRGQDE